MYDSHSPIRALCVGVSLAALLTGCSRSVSPVVTRDAGGAPSALADAAWTAASVHEPQTARARLRFIGSVVTLEPGFRTHLDRNAEFLVDADGFSPGDPPPLDTVPAFATLKQVRWRVAGAQGPEFVVDNAPEWSLDAPVPGAPGDGRLPPGTHLLRLRVPERAGGGEFLVLVRANFAPDMWWTGPDPARFPPASDGDGRAVDVLDWAHFTTSPAWPPDGRGYFGPDSFLYVPLRRLPVNGDVQRRTFYELWGDRIYARSEGDAVHQGAWVVFSAGGFDRDSPYTPIVSAGAPTLPPGFESQPDLYPLLIADGLNGSPIGFRDRVPVRLANGQLAQPAETTTHPNFDVASVFYSPLVASYWRVDLPGKAYAIVWPVDGHGEVGRTSEDLVALADRVDAGGGSAADRALRRRVLTFEVRPAAVAGRPESARGLH